MLVDFEWRRDSAGYHIETREASRGLLSTEGDEFQAVVRDGGPLVSYRPLEDEPSLFAILAAAEPTPEGVMGFATRFGFLWENADDPVDPNTWAPHIKGMRFVVDALEVGRFSDIVGAFNETEVGDLAIKFSRIAGRLRPALHFSPPNLMSAIWVQVAQHVSNDRQLRRCLYCGTGFVFGSGTGRRRSGNYCSDRCRKAAWLANKKSAR